MSGLRFYESHEERIESDFVVREALRFKNVESHEERIERALADGGRSPLLNFSNLTKRELKVRSMRVMWSRDPTPLNLTKRELKGQADPKTQAQARVQESHEERIESYRDFVTSSFFFTLLLRISRREN